MKRIVIIVLILCSELRLVLGVNNTEAPAKTNLNDTLKLMDMQDLGLRFYKYAQSKKFISLSLHEETAKPRQPEDAFTYDTLESECAAHLEAIRNGLLRKDLWSMKFIDAWGKIPSGILHGHLLEMGNFDECLSITHNSTTLKSNVRGKYCLAKLPFEAPATGKSILLKLGICVPAACQADEVNVLLEAILSKVLGSKNELESTVIVQESKCSVAETIQFEPIDWVAIAVLLLIVLLMISSTFYDYAATHFGKLSNVLLSSFSLRSNVKELFRCKTFRNSPHVIPCLYGIRCLSIIWVIFGHCYLLLLLSPNINPVDILTWARTPFSMFVQFGTVSVDTFFFLSGLLLVMVAFRQMERAGGHINIPLMYLHRYLRLTPVLALAILLYVSLYRYMGNGPLWSTFTSTSLLCNDTWWATLLYVQNYAAAGRMCFGHSWYLAVDMQLYVISPLILIPIWKWQRKGVAGLVVVGLLMFAALFGVIIVNGYLVFKPQGNLGADSAESRDIYYSTHSRALPWIVGIIFGYFMHKRAGRPRKLPKAVVALGWILSLSVLGSVLFALYPKTQPAAVPMTPLEGAFYLSLARIAWPLGLAWIVFACENGNSGPINQFLSWSLWQPMSKLSYCMYIWHLVIETINAGRTKTNTYFSNYDAILHFWGNFGVTILVSVAMYLAIESPFTKIEQCLLSPKKIPERSTATPSVAAAATISQENLCNK